jgi:hypothetical protein
VEFEPTTSRLLIIIFIKKELRGAPSSWYYLPSFRENEFSTASMTCITARDPKRLK